MIELLQFHDAQSPAIIDCRHRRVLTHRELEERVILAARDLKRFPGRPLVIHVCVNSIDAIVLYLACLEAGLPQCLVGQSGTDIPALLAAYRPELLLLPPNLPAPPGAAGQRCIPGTEYRVCSFDRPDAPPAHPDLALLLVTSGSTGSPKMVRLTLANLLANARSIVRYLNLDQEQRSIQSLPMYYSYGLSLINSHLLAGGAVVLTRHPFFTAEFWSDFDTSRSTSFAGVPYMYENLCSLHFDPGSHPSLRTMTQAGGGLRRDLIALLHQLACSAGVRFFVMYGQTEATARISYVPPERLQSKIGSIGIPIPDGRMEMDPVGDLDAFELIYSGPNVMMGYADGRAGLACGDELHGVLRTGDLVECDQDGFFYLKGRIKRVAKLFGRRINLADIETELENTYHGRAAVLEDGDVLRVFVEDRDGVDRTLLCRHLAAWLRIPPKFVAVVALSSIPVTATGKKDYKALDS